MEKRILYTSADGGLAVIVPAAKARRPKESDEAFLARVAAKAVPADATGAVPCDASEIPSDRTFRNAWCLADAGNVDCVAETSAVAVQMPKAREIHMARIRAARDAELARLDIEQLKGNDVAEEKQRLRDLPQTFDLTGAATPADLKARWPEELARAGASPVGRSSRPAISGA